MVKGPFVSPWRTISVAKTAIGLHSYSQLYLKLNPPPVNGVPAWIKPGKLIRAQLNTQSGIDCIDFAQRSTTFNILCSMRAGMGRSSVPVQILQKVIPQIDMPKVIQYGKENGIGVILYVNYGGFAGEARYYSATI